MTNSNNWPYIMDAQNFYVFRLNREMQYFEVKPISMEGTDLSPTYPGHQGGLLLDQILLHCTSEDDFFDTVMRCVSPSGISTETFGFSGQDAFTAKRRFFAALRQRAEESGISLCQNISLSSADYDYSIGDVLAAFNLKSVALLSLPAYSALDFNGSLIPIAPNDPEHHNVACPLHDFKAPGADITCFDDYFDAFAQGAFAYNNSDLFLTLYGLAFAIEVFVTQINWEGLDRFEDLVVYEPLNRTLNALVRMGALHSPFDKRPMWEYSQMGTDNAEEACQELAGTMALVSALRPISMLAPYERPFDTAQIFYGLIEHFSSAKDYFGIDYHTHLTFPGDYVPDDSLEADSGPILRWESFERRFDGAVGVRALIPGTEQYAEYCPGMEGAPLVKYTISNGDGSFRMNWVLVWDVPSKTIQAGNGPIQVRGVKQLAEALEPEDLNAMNELVESWNGLKVISVSAIGDFFQNNRSAQRVIGAELGLNMDEKASTCYPRLEPHYYEDGITGFIATAPNDINEVYWPFERFKLPTIRCVDPNSLTPTGCYVWDLARQTLDGNNAETKVAMGLQQLCESNCPEIIQELLPEVYSFYGIAVIPEKVADEAYEIATGDKLHKKSNFLY